MKKIDNSVVKVIGSFVNKTISGFELVGIEYQKSASLWGDYELPEERIIKTNIFVKKQKEERGTCDTWEECFCKERKTGKKKKM
jgi:hypothetical protein